MILAHPAHEGEDFFDADVLYSAAYLKESSFKALWRLRGVELVSSSFAVEECRRNLGADRPEALARLDRLLGGVTLVEERNDSELAQPLPIDAKDEPILLAAICSGAQYLLTGDKRHFGHLYGQTIRGVTVARPADYVRLRKDRERL